MNDLDDKDMKALLEKMLKSAKRIPKNKNNTPMRRPPMRHTGRDELVLRLLRIQEHIITARIDGATTDDIGALLDKVTVLLEQRC